MSLLIFGHHADVHSKAVAWAFGAKSLRAAIFCGDEVPGDATLSFEPGDDRWHLTGPDVDAALEDFAVVWNRRDRHPVMPDWIHKGDRRQAAGVCRIALDAMKLKLHPGQVWVNPRRNQLFIDSKPNQLRLAKAVGFTIPRTLISNDPAHIRAFVGGHPDCVAKSLHSMSWRDAGHYTVATTARVGLEHCRSDRPLRAAPMIYQERIEKAYELRVVLFGSDLLAVRLDTQKGNGRARVDWRFTELRDIDFTEVPCDEPVREKLLAFARAAGIVHGSFDLAVTPAGETVFFEVNEQGQTLWLEELNREIRVLDRLVQFLAKPDPGYVYDGARDVSFHDYLATAEWKVLEREIRELDRAAREDVGA
jgi:glutathione synthase/RimK-type ligase-like ATP-grasp enzyme